MTWSLIGSLCQPTLRAETPVSRLAEQSQFVDVTIVVDGVWRENASRTVLVTHGLGGTCNGDRFHGLVTELRRQLPEANIVLLDWSKASKAGRFGFPAPWIVARRIPKVAELATAKLQSLAIDPASMTFIGESFGNYVNAEIAAELGGVNHIIAFNPASEFGGYTPSDLRRHARQAWSFHTHSPFDTQLEISHVDLFLETPADASHVAQHTYGMVWLTEQLKAGRIGWLNLDIAPPETKLDAYRGKATLGGDLLDVAVPRDPVDNNETPAVVDERLAG